MLRKKDIIHSNNFGYISQCSCCQRITLCLGNVILVFERDEFFCFKEDFFTINDLDSVPQHNLLHKRFLFQTSYDDVLLSLSAKEYEKTCDLLNLGAIHLMIEEQIGFTS